MIVMHKFRNLGTTPILKKRTRSEKAILGATLGVPGYSRSNSRNGAHDLIYVKTPILGATLGATLGIGWTPNFQPKFSERFFKTGVVPVRQTNAYFSAKGIFLQVSRSHN